MTKAQMALYPPNWTELARICKERAGWKCEQCHTLHGAWIQSRTSGKVYKVRLAAAHLDHDPANPHPRLAALCNQCHLWHDRFEHSRQVKQTHSQRMYEAARAAGQLELFAEEKEEVIA